MNSARYFHTATKINDLSVLILGGLNTTTTLTKKCELYDISSRSFIPTKSDLITARYLHTATVLQNGNVLIAGGSITIGSLTPTAACEIYDAKLDSFISVPNMTYPRYGHCAVLLDSGKVLITGGKGPSNIPRDDAEIYDPISNTFTAISTATFYQKIELINNELDLSSKTKSDMPLFFIVKDKTQNTNTKSFNLNVKLPSLSSIDHGQTLTISCSSPAINNDYKINVQPVSSDIVIYNNNYNKPSVTLVADTIGTTKRWIALDNSG